MNETPILRTSGPCKQAALSSESVSFVDHSFWLWPPQDRLRFRSQRRVRFCFHWTTGCVK